MNDTMMFYLIITIGLLSLSIIIAADKFWGSKTSKSRS